MSDRILQDLARGFDAIFGSRVCRQCGMTVSADPLKHWHDDSDPGRAEASRIASDLQRESKDYADQEKSRRLA